MYCSFEASLHSLLKLKENIPDAAAIPTIQLDSTFDFSLNKKLFIHKNILSKQFKIVYLLRILIFYTHN